MQRPHFIVSALAALLIVGPGIVASLSSFIHAEGVAGQTDLVVTVTPVGPPNPPPSPPWSATGPRLPNGELPASWPPKAAPAPAVGDTPYIATPIPLAGLNGPRDPVANVGKYVAGETARVLYSLQVATREDVPCPVPCARDTDFARVIESIFILCGKMEPAALRGTNGFNAEVDEPPIARWEAVCNHLKDARQARGRPNENDPEWMAAANRAKIALRQQ